MTFDIEIAGRSRSVAIEPAGGTRFRVTVDGYSNLVDAVRIGDFALHADALSHFLYDVGDVGPGDEVTARQPVVVVEAMKMENELRSPRAGRVKDVSVAVGASVEAGRVLIVVE